MQPNSAVLATECLAIVPILRHWYKRHMYRGHHRRHREERARFERAFRDFLRFAKEK